VFTQLSFSFSFLLLPLGENKDEYIKTIKTFGPAAALRNYKFLDMSPEEHCDKNWQ